MYKPERNLENEIIGLLSNTRMYIKQISEELDVSRATAEKYLSILEAKGELEHEFLGVAKLYWVKK
jgi:predicted ArsR family transcriptional regulator